MSKYRLIIPKWVLKQLESLDRPLQKRVKESILALKDNPFPPGKKVKRIKGVYDEFWRLRVGDARVMYEVRGDEVKILGIVHREDKVKGDFDR